MSQRHSVADRMERLPVTATHRFICALIFITWASCSMNMTGTNFTLPLVINDFGFSNMEGGYFSSAAFAGMLVGSLVSGVLADKFGRKWVSAALVVVWGIGSVGTGFMNSLETLLACRVIAGIGMGAMTPILVAYISEIIPTAKRPKYITLYMLIGAAGVVAACLITMFFANGLGWRAVYWLEGAFGLTFLLIACFVPESAMWLETKGRLDKADEIVAWWEDKARASLNGAELPEVIDRPRPNVAKGKLTDLFTKKYIKIVAAGFVWFFCCMAFDFGLNAWITSLLMSKGFDVIRSVAFSALGQLGALPAAFCVTWISNHIGRRWSVMVGAVLAALFAYVYGLASTVVMVAALSILFQFGRAILSQASTAFLPELFETSLRSTGNGLLLAFGRIGGIAGPIIMAWSMTTFGMNGAFIVAACLALVCGLSVLLFLPETKGKVLD
mgnify:CR=1 FL=1